MKELLDSMLCEREKLLELIKIDNEIMNSNYSFEDYYDSFSCLLNNNCLQISTNSNSLFITEGNPIITVDLLRRLLTTEFHCIIFVNQGYLGINKWLINQFYKITGNSNVELDIGINYNKFIDKDYKVIPLGEEGIVEAVMEDFYG